MPAWVGSFAIAGPTQWWIWIGWLPVIAYYGFGGIWHVIIWEWFAAWQIPMARWLWRSGIVTSSQIFEVRFGGKLGAWLRAFFAIMNFSIVTAYLLGWVMGILDTSGEIVLGWAPGTTEMFLIPIAIVAAMLGGIRTFIYGVISYFLFLFLTAALIVYGWIGAGGAPGIIAGLTNLGKANFLEYIGPAAAPPLFILWAIAFILYWPNTQGVGMVDQWSCITGWENISVGSEAASVTSYPFGHQMVKIPPRLVLTCIPIFATLVLYPGVHPDLVPAYASTLLPSGLLGLWVASSFAWGINSFIMYSVWNSGWVVNDVYRRLISPGKSEKHYLNVERALILVAIGLGLLYWKVLGATVTVYFFFQYMVPIIAGGAGAILGAWYWWRFSGWAYAALMFIGLPVALIIPYIFPGLPAWPDWAWISGIATTLIMIFATLVTPPPPEDVLIDWYRKVRPAGFWAPIRTKVLAMERRSGGGF
jgi:Na+/proline symporter